MKYLLLLSLCLWLSSLSFAQACGYSQATFFIFDSDRTKLKNVEFLFLSKDTDDAILYSKEEIRWSDDLSAYKLRHGMCGAHHGVRLIIKPRGFEEFERIIDLPLNRPDRPQVYEIELKRKGSSKYPRKRGQ